MVKSNPLVSIVVPLYNLAHYADEAIQSILNQDYPNVELIVLDDGSTDGARQLLERYGGKFHWESHPNMGQVNTLNKGWRMARGEIFSYLSADDALLPSAVSRMAQAFAERSDVALVYCDFEVMDENSKTVRTIRAPEFDYPRLVETTTCAPGPGSFFRRAVFETAGEWDPSLRQIADYDYWLRLGLHGRGIRIPEVLARYRVHGKSLSFSSMGVSQAEEPVTVIKNYFQTRRVPPEVEAIKSSALSNAHLLSARFHLRSGRFLLGWRRLVDALNLSPRTFVSWRTAVFIVLAFSHRYAQRVTWGVGNMIAYLRERQYRSRH